MTHFARHAAFAAALLASTLVATAANADTLTPVAPPPGYTATQVSILGINNAGWTTGSVGDSGGAGTPAQGFLRAPDGTYTLFSSGASFTQGRNVSNSNQVLGFGSSSTDINSFRQFLRDPVTGGITTLVNPATMAPLRGIAQGINDSGAIVGNYQVAVAGFGTERNHGYILSGGTLTDIAYPGFPGYSISARGIANDGTVVGFSGRTGEAFIRSPAGAMTLFRRADAGTVTVLSAINNRGMAIGGYDDTGGVFHSFLYDIAAGTYHDINVPGATYTQTFGLNDSGQYVVSSDVGSFIFTPGGPSAPDGSSVFLPVDDGSKPDGTADFDFGVKPGQTYFIDPSFARGFEYLSGNNVDFTSVTLPIGVAPGDSYLLELWNGSAYHYAGRVQGGTAYNFAGSVDRFRIYGIPDGAGIDANDPSGFVTGLTFDRPGQFNGQQISLVPEPGQWALMIAGFGLAGLAARRRKARFATA